MDPLNTQPPQSQSPQSQPPQSIQSPATHQVARVKSVSSEQEVGRDPMTPGYIQTVQVELPDGELLELTYGSEYQPLAATQLLQTGQRVIVQLPAAPDQPVTLSDLYRLPGAVGLFLVFLMLVVTVAGRQGIRAIIGMVLSLLLLAGGLFPAIAAGYDPFLVCASAAVVIATFTIYLSHGWKFSSHVAWISLLSSLSLVALLSYGAVGSLRLSGRGSEEALFVQNLFGAQLPLGGLLLGGIVLGALGVLDDVIMAQISVVDELYAAKPRIKFPELFWRALRVGRSHVSSLVNTLVLAYAGTNLPLFLLFGASQEPWWAMLNSEFMMEEIVRTLAGSIGLIIAVPLTTLLAAAGWLLLPRILDAERLPFQIGE